MKNIILSNHISLDAFVASPKGEMDWIRVDEQLFDYVTKLTSRADTAMYGRVTYQMMDNYWPGAADKPGATKHDVEHSRWYNSVQKVVISKTLDVSDKSKTTVIGKNLVEQVLELKKQAGKDILIFGSPSAAQSLMKYNLIDEYWLFVNPILLGDGLPLFKKAEGMLKLKLVESQTFKSGVVELHYERIK